MNKAYNLNGATHKITSKRKSRGVSSYNLLIDCTGEQTAKTSKVVEQETEGAAEENEVQNDDEFDDQGLDEKAVYCIAQNQMRAHKDFKEFVLKETINTAEVSLFNTRKTNSKIFSFILLGILKNIKLYADLHIYIF